MLAQRVAVTGVAVTGVAVTGVAWAIAVWLGVAGAPPPG